MTQPVPRRTPAAVLSPVEETLWRATMRIVTMLPSQLDTDLVRSASLTASEYTTLVHLAEAPDHELRMGDLAKATGLSASRTTRLVDGLQRRGLVAKVSSSADARSTSARTTTRGMAKLGSAHQTRLDSVRRRVIDHIDPSSVEQLADALSVVAHQLDTGSVVRRDPPTVASKSKLI